MHVNTGSNCRLALLLASALTALASPIRADEVSSPAKEWRSYCQSYMKALEGDTKTSDLDVTYCVGVTKGLLDGMMVGTQLGALSFGSKLAVRHNLDRDEVFKLFQAQEPSRLLGICAPVGTKTADFIRPVLAQLERKPDDAQRPIVEVFYEALAAAYPCR